MDSSSGLSNLKASSDTFLPFTPFSFNHDSKLFSDPLAFGSQLSRKSLEGVNHHQRCSSESFIEQPSWLDDLLNDSENIFYKGHRRSASDSYTYLGESATTLLTGDESEFVNAYFGTSTRSQNPGHYKNFDSTSVDTKGSPLDQKNNQETEGTSFLAIENSRQESTAQNLEGSPDKASSSQAKNAGSKTDSKRSKQHNAHRSRVRKLQYIAHLERTLEMLKAEGSEISAELEFVEQQNIILTMENKALRQRLESLSQEQLIKHWEQGMLEREIGRLQSLYHLQKEQQMHMHHQQQQQQVQTHNQYSKQRRNRSRDIDHQANNASLKNKEASSTKGSVNGSIHI